MRKVYIWLLFSAWLLVCGTSLGQKAGESHESRAGLDKVPAGIAARQNPYEGSAQAALAGKKLYRRYCAQCHGPEGRGQGKAPDLHSPVVQNALPGTLFWFLKNGNLREGMPSWSHLPDERLWQLITYLKTLR
jgi:mono/diheme cytochrome c family protein